MATIKKKVYYPIVRELFAGHKDPEIRNMTQKAIAEKIDTSKQTMNRWFESDRPFDNPPYTGVAYKLANLLGEAIVDNLWKEGYVDVEVPPELAPAHQLI